MDTVGEGAGGEGAGLLLTREGRHELWVRGGRGWGAGGLPWMGQGLTQQRPVHNLAGADGAAVT